MKLLETTVMNRRQPLLSIDDCSLASPKNGALAFCPGANHVAAWLQCADDFHHAVPDARAAHRSLCPSLIYREVRTGAALTTGNARHRVFHGGAGLGWPVRAEHPRHFEIRCRVWL